MGLFDYFFPPPIVECDTCGSQIEGDPILHRGKRFCVACDAERQAAVERQREAEEAARERIANRQRFMG